MPQLSRSCSNATFNVINWKLEGKKTQTAQARKAGVITSFMAPFRDKQEEEVSHLRCVVNKQQPPQQSITLPGTVGVYNKTFPCPFGREGVQMHCKNVHIKT